MPHVERPTNLSQSCLILIFFNLNILIFLSGNRILISNSELVQLVTRGKYSPLLLASYSSVMRFSYWLAESYYVVCLGV